MPLYLAKPNKIHNDTESLKILLFGGFKSVLLKIPSVTISYYQNLLFKNWVLKYYEFLSVNFPKKTFNIRVSFGVIILSK